MERAWPQGTPDCCLPNPHAEPHDFDIKCFSVAGHEGTLKIILKIQIVVFFMRQTSKEEMTTNVPVLL